MTTIRRAVSVRLDPEAKRRLEKAAGLTNQTPGDFLRKAGDETARLVLLDWAVARYRDGESTFSELAEQTGLAVEEIMAAMSEQGHDAALERFLLICRSIAGEHGGPDFVRLAARAVERVRGEG
jgi:uncharacterized protein (DUF1778 family)